jgi:hypothetical protein
LKNIGLIKPHLTSAASHRSMAAASSSSGCSTGPASNTASLHTPFCVPTIARPGAKIRNMIKDSHIGFEPGIDGSYTTDLLKIPPPSKFFQGRFTLGVAFAF